MGKFTKDVALTYATKVSNLIIGVGSSVIIARILGPEGKGIYTMAILLPTLIITFSHLGIGLANVYYVAKRRYPLQVIIGSNITLAFLIGSIGVCIGLIVSVLFGQRAFPGVIQRYLFIALIIVPFNLLFVYLEHILLGASKIREYNLISFVHAAIFLAFICIMLWMLQKGIEGAIWATVVSWLVADAVLLLIMRKVAGRVAFMWDSDYLKQATTYGVKAHLGSILRFLNLRLDLFLVNVLLNPTAVGFYSVSVGLAEKLWLVSQASSTVLLPRVAGETNETRRRDFTPLVARTTLWITVLGSVALILLSKPLIVFLYTEKFLPSIGAVQALLVGIVAVSVGRILGSDIAGRGRPILNTYVGIITVMTNVILNIVWIPRHGITGAAWASTVSYTLTLMARLFLYCRLSKNSCANVLIPQKGDWALYWKVGKEFFRRKRRE